MGIEITESFLYFPPFLLPILKHSFLYSPKSSMCGHCWELLCRAKRNDLHRKMRVGWGHLYTVQLVEFVVGYFRGQ